ncbi:peptidylprolyl isomerase [Mycoplasmatota bacterium WC44]
MKKILTTLVILVTLLAGCDSTPQEKPITDYQNLPYYGFIKETNPEVTIVFSDKSEIKIQLFPEIAPNTVNNFLALAEDNFYDGIIFHRVIENFVMQGGDPDGTGMGGADYNIVGEFIQNGINNTLQHHRGVISMARSQKLNSASSQFFLVHADSNFLDEAYAGFGGILEGFDVLDKFSTAETDQNDRPLEEIKIKDVIVNKKIVSYAKPVTLSKEYYAAETYLDTNNPRVEITFDDDQVIELELFPEVAPTTVENFIKLINEEFYNGLTIHRVFKDFAILGGDPDGDGSGGSDETIFGEFKENAFNNNLTHQRGVISMFRTEEKNSGSSQFFIITQDTQTLDGDYAAFGFIISGLDVLDSINEIETDDSGNPSSDIIIKSIKVK